MSEIKGVKTSMKIYEYPQKFVMKRCDEYPVENVKNMIAAWEDRVRRCKEFLDAFDKNLVESKDVIAEALEKEKEAEQKFIEERLSMDKEELKNVLYQEYMDVVKEKQENHKQFEEMKKQNEQHIEKEFRKRKAEYEKELKEKQDSIDVWTKTIRR
jgi:hypothetical protein